MQVLIRLPQCTFCAASVNAPSLKNATFTELQIRKGIEDNLIKEFFLFLKENIYVVTSHYSCLSEMVLMRGHDIHFYAEIMENYP